MKSSNSREETRISNALEIPWLDRDQWQQALDSIIWVTRRNEKAFWELKENTRMIGHGLDRLSQIMDRLCRATCPACKEICCAHATVWYDFKDLLFQHLSGLDLPARQIRKIKNEYGENVCVHQTPEGCILPRSQRPYICTWYVCPAQKSYIDAHCRAVKSELGELLDHIKELRGEIEDGFVNISSKQVVSGDNEL